MAVMESVRMILRYFQIAAHSCRILYTSEVCYLCYFRRANDNFACYIYSKLKCSRTERTLKRPNLTALERIKMF